MTPKKLRTILIKASEIAATARNGATEKSDRDMWTIVIRIFSTLSKAIGKVCDPNT